MFAVADLVLRPHEALRHGGFFDEEGPRDLGRLQTGDQAQRQGHPCVRCERRMAAGEDQAQPVVVHGPSIDWFVCGMQQCRLFLTVISGTFSADTVDGPVAGGGDDPTGGTRRQTVGGPPFECDLERVLDRFFGDIDIAEEADQAGDRTPRLAAEHTADLRGIDRLGHGVSPRTRLAGDGPRPDPYRQPWPDEPTRAQRRGRAP